jgi:hypothetical protein
MTFKKPFECIRVGDDVYEYATHEMTHVDIENPCDPTQFVRVERIKSVTYRTADGKEIVFRDRKPDKLEEGLQWHRS